MKSRRKLKNLAGVEVPASTLQRHVVRIGKRCRRSSGRMPRRRRPRRILLGIDGAGVPMAAREVEGVAGKQADGTEDQRGEDRHLLHGQRPGPEDRGASERPQQRGGASASTRR